MVDSLQTQAQLIAALRATIAAQAETILELRAENERLKETVADTMSRLLRLDVGWLEVPGEKGTTFSPGGIVNDGVDGCRLVQTEPR